MAPDIFDDWLEDLEKDLKKEKPLEVLKYILKIEKEKSKHAKLKILMRNGDQH